MRHDLFHDPVPEHRGGLAGCRSLTAMWERITVLTSSDLWTPTSGPSSGASPDVGVHDPAMLQDLDPADLDAHLGS